MKIGSGLSIFKSDASGDSLNFPVICKIQFSTLFFTPLWPYVKLNTCPTTLSELTIAEGIKLNTQFAFLGESGIYNGALTSVDYYAIALPGSFILERNYGMSLKTFINSGDCWSQNYIGYLDRFRAKTCQSPVNFACQVRCISHTLWNIIPLVAFDLSTNQNVQRECIWITNNCMKLTIL